MTFLTVGSLVRCPAQPDWGMGQVQSVTSELVTVMFEHAGKRVFRNAEDALDLIRLDPPRT